MKTCPYCAEEVKDEAIKCKHCGSMLAGELLTPGLAETAGYISPMLEAGIRAGLVLSRRYEVAERLGSGGMGEVWKARDRELSLDVAIKVLPPMLSRNMRCVEALRKEAAITLRLTSPNICRLYNFDADGDVRFLVMEYVTGQTLDEMMDTKPDRKLTMAELLPVAEGIATALNHAHGISYTDSFGRQVKGVLHRDIKPQNIMVNSEGAAKLMDFGIAQEIHTTMTALTGRTGQTPLYASPEQFRGEKVTPASDIYSFAAVVYECLTGQRLVSPHGDVPWQVLQKPFERSSFLPDAVNAALEAALAKEPGDRPAGADKFVELLSGGGTIFVHEPPSPAPQAPAPPADVPEAAPPATAAPREPVVRPRRGDESTPISKAWPFDAQDARRRQQVTAGALGQPIEQDLEIGEDRSLTLVLVPPGRFLMGSDIAEADRRADEEPLREVTITCPVYMGVHPVTQEQYAALMGDNPSRMPGPTRPVEQVSWEQAVSFCRRLSDKTGRPVRLPTEAEWEHACRAGTSTAYHTGETIDTRQANFCGRASFSGGTQGTYREETTPVGSFEPNAWGLCDMHGNVWEWCSDWYDAEAYADGGATDPVGPDSGRSRALRGGCWFTPPAQCRSACRLRHSPQYKHASTGFRVVMAAD